MPRFMLREFSVPDYRGSLPKHDPNNAIWPRISAFAKMLHDISWEDDGDEKAPDEDDVRLASDDASSDMSGYESPSSQMEGYHPQTAEEAKAQESEGQSRAPTDMEKQKEMASSSDVGMDDFIKNFDPKTASKEDIRKMQRIIAPADAVLSDPDDKPSYKFFDDADWGKASQKALEEYMKTWGY